MSGDGAQQWGRPSKKKITDILIRMESYIYIYIYIYIFIFYFVCLFRFRQKPRQAMGNSSRDPLYHSSGTDTPGNFMSRSEACKKKRIGNRINIELSSFLASNGSLQERALEKRQTDNSSAWTHMLRNPKKRALIVTLCI